MERADAELLSEIRAGAGWAVSALYERHRPPGLRLVRRISRVLDPEDMLHDAWAKILRAIHGGAGPREEFTPYYYSAIRSVVYTRTAREMRTARAEVVAADSDVTVDVDAPDDPLVREAFGQLPERHRLALWAAEVEGMSRQEIGSMLRLDAPAVSALLYRARAGLRREWLRMTDSPEESDMP